MNSGGNFKTDFGTFIGESAFLSDYRRIVDSIKSNTASVLVYGEKGSGKKTFAEFLHLSGAESANGFYAFNSSEFADDFLLDSLSNIVSSDFNGKRRSVYIAQAEFLPLELQSKLVAFIKNARQTQKDIRFIFAAESSLEEAVENGKFSKELYYSISTVCVNMISLRNRKEDIPLLANYFFKNIKAEFGSFAEGFSESALLDMQSYFWPGNVAELKNAIERAVILANGPLLKTSELGIQISKSSDSVIQDMLQIDSEDKTLKTAIDSFKREYISKVLEENSWNQTKSAKALGIQRTYVIKLINELNIRKK